MARADLLSIMYSKERSPLEFQFDSLVAPPLNAFLTPMDIMQLQKIATSLRYSDNVNAKYKAIDQIMRARGCKKFHSGTNRVIYSILDYPNYLLKIAFDKVGMNDNPAEYRNQFLLKPFVTKVFEVSPCGTVALVERVQPITSRQEFMSIAESIFDLITNCIIGKYVLEDIGTKFFMNYGIRNGFGAVLLDFPYVFELDGSKLYCTRQLPDGSICNGEIDYDDGFNNLVCTKCGKKYLAIELEKKIKENKIKIFNEDDEESTLNVRLIKNGKVVIESKKETSYIVRR